MKKILIVFICLAATFFSTKAPAQAPPDSVLKKYNSATDFWLKYRALSTYLESFEKNDSLLVRKSVELREYFKKQNDIQGINHLKYSQGDRALWKNDFATALEIFLPLLSEYKSISDTAWILQTAQYISIIYLEIRDFQEAINYEKERTSFLLKGGNKKLLCLHYSTLGYLYAKALAPDSGLVYTQKALAIVSDLKDDSFQMGPLMSMAENYMAKGDYEIAMLFLRKLMMYKSQTEKRFGLKIFDPEINNIFAKANLGLKQYDSTIYFAHLAHAAALVSNPNGDLIQQLTAYEYLYKSFEAKNMPDSSNKYFRLAISIKDSIANTEKVKSIEASGFRAMQRKEEMKIAKEMADEEHKKNIEYAALGIGIILLLIIFLLLSRTIIVKPKVVRGFGILGLLLTFEFLNLLLHPFLEKITNHSPSIMLLCLAGLASLLIPFHHRLEKYITTKLVEKNELIRLAAAKRIIEESEKNQINE